MTWKHLFIFYTLVSAVGIGLLFLFPSPPVAEVVGGFWSVVTFGTLMVFVVQKAVQGFAWVKAKRHRS
jgi:hypothetical protein